MNVPFHQQHRYLSFLGRILITCIALTQMPNSLLALIGGGCTNSWDCPDLIDYTCPIPPGKGEGCATCDRHKGGVGTFGIAGGGVSSAGTGVGRGMPAWRVSEPQLSLWIHDEPLGYQPAYGPRVSFLLSYKQRDYTVGFDTNVFGAGKGWNFSWLSYVVPSSTSAEVYLAGGGVVKLLSTDTYDYHSGKQWFWPQSAADPFILESHEGSRDTYGFFVTNNAGQIQRAYLSERSDATGHSIRFEYAAYNPSAPVVRLLRVIDAEGRQTTLEYNAGSVYSTNLISAVVDPWGRTNRLAYDPEGYLTNIVDVAGISTSFQSHGWTTNMVTPYGTTSFRLIDAPSSGRMVEITEPDGGKQLFVNLDEAPGITNYLGAGPNTAPFENTFDTNNLSYRNTFHWDRLQYQQLSSAYQNSGSITQLTSSDFLIARWRHWLARGGGDFGFTLSLERLPSRDGANAGQLTWYDHSAKVSRDSEGTQMLPLLVARTLPDGSTWFERTERNGNGLPLEEIGTYSKADGSVGLRTNTYTYTSDDIDLVQQIGPLGEQVVSNYFNNNFHQPDASYDALNQETRYYWNAKRELVGLHSPGGLTTTNFFFTGGTYADWLDKTIDLEIQRTNSFTYDKGLIYSQTDPRGLTTTNFWDNLQRLTGVKYPDGTAISNIYTKLDLTAAKDRLGNWTYFGYDLLQRNTAITNANGAITRYGYCDCGQLTAITNAWNTSVQLVTQFSYDLQGNRTTNSYPDGTVTNSYDELRRLTTVADGQGYRVFLYNNQGLVTNISNALGTEQAVVYDTEDRPFYVTDANGVTVTNTFDALGRLRTRTQPDTGVESFGYSARGLVAHTNQLGRTNFYAYDRAGRRTFETNANGELIQFQYNPSGDLTNLIDGKNQTTKWYYDEYGRVTNKLDQAGTEVLRFKYDPNSRVTNRWTAAKGDTQYKYDPVGNLTNVDYAASTDLTFGYDALNRLTNMVDAVGTTKFAYAAGGQLWTEDGPWSGDTVTNGYLNRFRTNLSLAQPTGSWTNGFAYDAARRLTNVTSQAGAFNYLYSYASPLPLKVSLPNTSYITNTYDTMARLTGTYLKNSSHTALDSYTYVHNPANQRTNLTRTDSSTYDFTYDPIGQLKIANGSVNAEDRGYAYDAAWNLNYRTNNGALNPFSVGGKNQLTAVGGTACFYDGNGNLLHVGQEGIEGTVDYGYDDENRLVAVATNYNILETPVSGLWQTYFTYDGLGRLRQRLEYVDDVLRSTTRYIYDGWRVIQERNGANTPTVSYTRGNDLSGSLEGAGGIGGLLARSHGYSGGNWSTHNFYHADGGGNIAYLVDASQALAASYRYDPFGNLISSSGSLANANVYRFSSKETHVKSGMYYYGARFYEPNLQRWLNRDPIGERGGINLYTYVGNLPVAAIDPFGLTLWYCTRPTTGPFLGIGRHGYIWDDRPWTDDSKRECGQEGSPPSKSPTSSRNEGPRQSDPLHGTYGDDGWYMDEYECTPIPGSEGMEDAVMRFCDNNINDRPWLWPVADCHTAAKWVLGQPQFNLSMPPFRKWNSQSPIVWGPVPPPSQSPSLPPYYRAN